VDQVHSSANLAVSKLHVLLSSKKHLSKAMMIIIIIYSLLVGCHPVAVVTLHLNYVKPTKLKTGGLHEKHVVAT
jgi:hypothetical protein